MCLQLHQDLDKYIWGGNKGLFYYQFFAISLVLFAAFPESVFLECSAKPYYVLSTLKVIWNTYVIRLVSQLFLFVMLCNQCREIYLDRILLPHFAFHSVSIQRLSMNLLKYERGAWIPSVTFPVQCEGIFKEYSRAGKYVTLVPREVIISGINILIILMTVLFQELNQIIIQWKLFLIS